MRDSTFISIVGGVALGLILLILVAGSSEARRPVRAQDVWDDMDKTMLVTPAGECFLLATDSVRAVMPQIKCPPENSKAGRVW